MPYTAKRAIARTSVAVLKRVLAPALAALVVGACAHTGGTATEPEIDVSSLSLYEAIEALTTPSDRVLHHMQAGLALYEQGDLENARRSFEVAYGAIETIYADNPAAKRARSAWHAEAVKDFRGEPYERSAVGYYLGLIEMAGGQYDNARASFKWGMLQDTMAADETYHDDMAVLAYLRAWATMCTAGDPGRAADDVAAFRRLRPGERPPHPEHNLLIIAESGSAPVKYGRGRYREALTYQPGASTGTKHIVSWVGGKRVELAQVEDLYWQATTLGGRYVDSILAGKASFKDDLEDTSEAMSTVASTSFQLAAMSAAAGGRDEAAALGAVALISAIGSLASSAAAESVKPAADIRAWANLPHHIHAASLKVDRIPAAVKIQFVNENGQLVGSRDASVRVSGRCGYAWARELPASPVAQATLQHAIAERRLERQRREALRKEQAKGVPSF